MISEGKAWATIEGYKTTVGKETALKNARAVIYGVTSMHAS